MEKRHEVLFNQLNEYGHLTKEPIKIPDGFNEWFRFGTSPSDWKTTPPTLEELKQLLAKQPLFIRETYGERSEEEFFSK